MKTELKVETVDEFKARGGKVKVRKISARLRARLRARIKGDSRFHFHQTKDPRSFE